MQENLLFWTLGTALLLGVLSLVLAPLVRGAGRPERRASYDMQVYRDQLREVDADVARGVLTLAEADAVRVEVSRRLLAAADAEAAEAAAVGGPRGLSRATAAAAAIGVAAAAGGIYVTVGAPGRPDQPLAGRRAVLAEARAERPSQAEVEAIASPAGATAGGEPAPLDAGPAAGATPEDLDLVQRLRAAVAARPDDAQGHRLLARTEASLGAWVAARAAQERAVDLAGPAASADDLLDLAEFMIIAANGYVSPEAEVRLSQVLQRAPEQPVARYYSGLALLQGGRADLTFQLWSRLLAEGPADAPWIAPISDQIDEVAMLAGQTAPEAPTRGDVAAAQGLSEADRAAMISGMVAQLSERLAAEGGSPEDWAQLIRSLGVLGRVDEAAAIWREVRETFAADPDALALLRDTAAEAGVAE